MPGRMRVTAAPPSTAWRSRGPGPGLHRPAGYEYSHAAFGLADTAYAAAFYIATGFHGLHVIIGTIFLAVCLLRFQKGQMTKDQHLGFEAAAWYWHFVDVIWLVLFAVIYVWGS